MQHEILAQRIDALVGEPALDTVSVLKLRDVLKHLGPWDLFRINPLTFAEEYGFERDLLINIFLYGVRCGLFDFSWNLICPLCGTIEYTHSTVNTLSSETDGHFHCTQCDIDIDIELDEMTEVAFALNRSVYPFELDYHATYENNFRYFRSQNFQPAQAVLDYVVERNMGYYQLPKATTIHIPIELLPNEAYHIFAMDCHDVLAIRTTAETHSSQEIDIELSAQGFKGAELQLAAGSGTLHVYNHTGQTMGITIYRIDVAALRELVYEHPPSFKPFLSGKLLLNNQTFRELFKMEQLIPDLKLHMRSITLLFTDLKGSTAMYDSVGDINAYKMVHDHFNILRKAVDTHHGAIVKTMGDAIMASFSRPDDGVAAALDMFAGMQKLNETLAGDQRELGLKVGLHEGSALVVNADDRLDYFGQTVNVAARVQGLAVAGELCLSDAVYEHGAVQQRLAERSLTAEKSFVSLKGVGQPTGVYRFQLP